MSINWGEQTIEELAPLIRKREISPVELTKSLLEQISNLNNSLNAYINVWNEKAIQEAKQAEQEIKNGNYKGSLHGIPMGIKDNIYFKDEQTTIGSHIHKDYKPSYDATVVKRMKEAGVIFTGKLNLHEYALGITTNNPFYGPCRNPWNIEKIPGGSSGGSAVSVVSEMSVASLGTDTSGSIRIPAAACGIVGLKPTFGRVSKYGCFPEAWTLDHIGPMTKNVYDAAELLRVIAGYDENDPMTVDKPVINYTDNLTTDISDMVIGIEETYYFKNIDKPIDSLVRKGIKELENMGALIKPIKIPALKDSEFALKITDISETSTVHDYNIKNHADEYGKDVRALIELGEIPSAVDYLQAQQIRNVVKTEFDRVFREVDVIIAPTLSAMPPNIGEENIYINGDRVNIDDGWMRLIGPANLAGLPSLTVPCGMNEGMPVGMQIIGGAFKESDVLRMGYAYESLSKFHREKPNLGH